MHTVLFMTGTCLSFPSPVNGEEEEDKTVTFHTWLQGGKVMRHLKTP
jgi:hypothetical protein